MVENVDMPVDYCLVGERIFWQLSHSSIILVG